MNNYPSPRLCPNCGNSVSPEDSFCPVCGTAVPAPAPQPITPAAAPEPRCASCGAVLTHDASFCAECGAPVPVAAPAPVSQPSSAPVEHRCASCGELLDPDAVFCGNCGTKVVKDAAPTPPVDSGYQPPVYASPVSPASPAYQPPVPPAAPKAALSWWPVSNRLTDLCSSGSALTMAILVSASLLMSLISGTVSGASFIGNIVSNVATILSCIGLWMCFVGARKNNLTTGGFTVLSAGLIYSLVLCCIVFGLLIILSLILVAVGDEIRWLGLIMLLIFGGILALFVVYNTQLRRSVKTAKQIITNGQGQIYTNMYSIVLLYISAGWFAISLIFTAALQRFLRDMFLSMARSMPSESASTIYSLLSTFNGGSGVLGILSGLITVALPIIAALALHRLYKNQTNWVR